MGLSDPQEVKDNDHDPTITTTRRRQKAVSYWHKMVTMMVRTELLVLLLLFVVGCYKINTLTGTQPQQQPGSPSSSAVQEETSSITATSTTSQQRWLLEEEGIFGSDPTIIIGPKPKPQNKQLSIVVVATPATIAPTSAPPTTASPSDSPSVSAEPTNPPTISAAPTLPVNEAHIVGNNGSPQDVFPLAKCRGDCDSDNECDWGLICYQRDREWEEIPGCEYDDDWDVYRGTQDFCIPSPDLLENAFRLKMYWQNGYEWQNSTDEMFFCMTTDYEGYKDGRCCVGKCWYGEEALECRSDQVYIERCINSPGPQSDFYLRDEQQAFRFLPVGEEAFDDDWSMWEISRKAPRAMILYLE